jgi:NTP pyrophosphatase (non-canonical NTP hydrolase)
MMGEVGELCEIFQWRGCIGDMSSFKSQEITHLGEEIADVFIYNTRLADLCGVDLAQAIQHHIEGRDLSMVADENTTADEFRVRVNKIASEGRVSMSFAYCTRALLDKHNSLEGAPPDLLPRHMVLAVSATVGSLCQLVLNRPEHLCPLGLPSWPAIDIRLLATGLADVACHLITLASLADLDIGKCLRDKLAKNSAKYPAHLVQGSSAKYTAYTHMLKTPSSSCSGSSSGNIVDGSGSGNDSNSSSNSSGNDSNNSSSSSSSSL